MGDISCMAISDSLNDLAPEELSFNLRHLSVRLHLQVSMQGSSIDKLHNQEDLLMTFKRFVKLGNVRVVELLHDFHFTFD